MPRSTALAPRSSISQLDRLLRALPEQAGGTPGRPELERACRVHHEWDGWVRGTFCLPADEGALVPGGLIAARDAELRDRHDVDPADPAPPAAAEATAAVSWADGLVRPAVEATDALDPTVRRTGHRGHRGQRALVVLHHDVEPGGHLGAAQLDLGPVVPDAVARYLSCDARVQVVSHRAGRLVGIDLTERTVSPAMRRYLARRDQGCVHPLCAQRRWLHVHHLVHWAAGGRTTPGNLALLCPRHHRALHHGDLSLHGDPEAGTLQAHDRWGRPISAPAVGCRPPPRLHLELSASTLQQGLSGHA